MKKNILKDLRKEKEKNQRALSAPKRKKAETVQAQKTVPWTLKDLDRPCPAEEVPGEHGKALRAARIARGWSQAKTAVVFNVSLNCIAKWEAGDRFVLRGHLRLLQGLDVLYPL
jgi:ribosome-binding protein aMBF1 (putative translation factor)